MTHSAESRDSGILSQRTIALNRGALSGFVRKELAMPRHRNRANSAVRT